MTKKPLTPEVIALWHPTKNIDVDIHSLSGGSGRKVWWKCSLKHDFQAAVRDVSGGHGCPYCAGNKVWEGFNDFQTTHPELASEWHPTKNEDLKPSHVSFGSKTKVWWIGKCGHEFIASVGGRSVSNNNCPYCAGQKILIGFNDLGTTHPSIASQWHPEKNGELTPQDFTPGTNKKVWWLGVCGHDFFAAISEKIRSGDKGCPYCSGKSILVGFNDLGSLYPEIAKEWHPDNPMSAYEISAKSAKPMKWLCSNGHSFKTQVRARVQQGAKCPYCSGARIIAGTNDLGSTHPQLISEWDFEKNGDKLPSHYSKSNHDKVWWLCNYGENHSYLMPIQSRTESIPAGCNFCSNRFLLKGFNDLATKYPTLASQWHPTLNENLMPEMILASHRHKVWWKCAKGHEWEVSPIARIRRDSVSKCPTCQSKQFASQAEKDLALMLKEVGVKVLANRRNIINGLELDLYLPEYNVAIEYNGLYWHTIRNNGKHKNCHYDKWKACKDAGINLIQIWEDDWKERKQIVLRSIVNKIGLSSEDQKTILGKHSIQVPDRIFARKTVIDKASKEEAEKFLESNHIQGFASGSHYLCAKTKDGDIVSLMVLKKEANDTLNIIRYATDRSVVGGFTKMVKYATKEFNPKSFITFSDNCISDGGLYANNGFIVDKVLAPDYMYHVGHKRKHKFGYRIQKFKNDPKLKYEEGLTERELADLNGLYRIYDAGKIKWRLNVS